MRIAFLPDSCIPFHGNTLQERPLGGTETAVIRLAKSLHALGHRTIVFTPINEPPLTDPLYVPFTGMHYAGKLDALIVVRRWLPLFTPIQACKRFFWTGDSHDQMAVQGIGDRRVISKMDALLTVSEWHTATLCRESGFPTDKCWCIRNGIDAADFNPTVERKRKRLIYSSTPYRGLAHLPRLFERIKLLHPDAELHIFSDYQVYAGAGAPPPQALHEFEVICRTFQNMSGCYLHGTVTQTELAKELLLSAVLAYPNTFEETSCITAMEAQAAGSVVVTTARAALPETVGDAGILIAGEPGTPSYDDAFVAAIDSLLQDDILFNSLSAKSIKRAKQHDWHEVAKRFVEYLQHEHGL